MKLNVACLQLTSNDQPKENLDHVINFSEQAIQSGADFILTPENTFLFTMDKKILELDMELAMPLPIAPKPINPISSVDIELRTYLFHSDENIHF